MVGIQGRLLLISSIFLGVWYSLRVSLRAKASMSLLMSYFSGGSGVGQKLSPLRRRFVPDCVSWMSDKFTVRLFKIFSICVELSRAITLGLSLLIVHFRSNVCFPMICFWFDFNVSLCICSWRVGVLLKDTAVVMGAYLLHTGCNLLIDVGSVYSPVLCPVVKFLWPRSSSRFLLPVGSDLFGFSFWWMCFFTASAYVLLPRSSGCASCTGCLFFSGCF